MRRPLLLGSTLFAAVTAVRFLTQDVTLGVAFLYVLPITVFAVGFGRRAGLGAALASIATLGVWASVEQPDLDARAYAIRTGVLLLVGVLTGHLAAGQREALAAAERDAHDKVLAEARFRRAFEDSPVGVAVVAADGEILEANARLGELLGMAPADLVGWRSLLILADPAEARRVERSMRALHAGAIDVYRDELRIRRGRGDTCWIALTSSIVRDGDGRPLYRLSQLEDVSARKAHEELLVTLAEEDHLTGLLNRRGFERELEREVALGRPGALCLLDLDDFKAINDTHGHAAGDAVLEQVATALVARLRATDVVARLGGDEFAVILRGADAYFARDIAEELVRCVTEATAAGVGASVGVATYTGRPDAGELVTRADRAMYAAKRAGRRRAVLA